MALELFAVVIAFSACALACTLGPFFVRLAHRTGIVARGDGVLRRQQQPVAYLGGLLILCSAIAPLVLCARASLVRNVAILGTALLAVGIGLLDDRRALRPSSKLLAQLALALASLTMNALVGSAPGTLLGMVVNICWLVILLNAVNFLDVADGVCGLVCAAILLVMTAHAVLLGDADTAALGGSMLGATAGFLVLNWQPARIYLGESGTMLLSGVLAAMSWRASGGAERESAPLLAPVLFVSLPLFEFAFVIAARIALSLPVHLGSPDHMAVRLRARGHAPPTVALLLGAIALLSALSASLAAVSPASRVGIIASAATAYAGLGAWLWKLDRRHARGSPTEKPPTLAPSSFHGQHGNLSRSRGHRPRPGSRRRR